MAVDSLGCPQQWLDFTLALIHEGEDLLAYQFVPPVSPVAHPSKDDLLRFGVGESDPHSLCF